MTINESLEESERNGIVPIIMTIVSQNDITRHPKVVIKYPLGDHPNIIIKAQAIHDAMKTSPWTSGITGIVTKLASFQTDIATYTSLEANAKRVSGGVGARDTFSSTFITETSEDLRVIVQGVVNLNKTSAIDIAKSCDMEIQGAGGRSPFKWTVTHGKLSGSVDLSADISEYNTRRYCSQWQRTKDASDPASWYLLENEILPTLQAKTTVFDLRVKDTVSFRFRLILSDGPTEWSDVIQIIII